VSDALLGQVVTLTVLLNAGLDLIVRPVADRYGYGPPLFAFAAAALAWWPAARTGGDPLPV
jgi:hypothetical protein